MAQTKAEHAKQLFLDGYNCAQSIVGAFCDDMGLSFDYAVKMASPFGGGMGRLREVCGAVSGMFMVIGAKYGYSDIADKQQKVDLYKLVQHLAKQFVDKNGSIVCGELLAGLVDKSPIPEQRTAEYHKSRKCAEKVYDAALILQNYLDSNA